MHLQPQLLGRLRQEERPLILRVHQPEQHAETLFLKAKTIKKNKRAGSGEIAQQFTALLLVQRTSVQFLAPTSGSWQPPVTPALGELTVSFGIWGNPHAHIYIININLNFLN